MSQMTPAPLGDEEDQDKYPDYKDTYYFPVQQGIQAPSFPKSAPKQNLNKGGYPENPDTNSLLSYYYPQYPSDTYKQLDDRVGKDGYYGEDGYYHWNTPASRARQMFNPGYEPSYWENPVNIVKAYHQLKYYTPEGQPPPEWMDPEQITRAYEYLRFVNKGDDWTNWGWLHPEDPGRQFLQTIPPPSLDFALSPTDYQLWQALEFSQTPPDQWDKELITKLPPQYWYELQGINYYNQMQALQQSGSYPAWQRFFGDVTGNPMLSGAITLGGLGTLGGLLAGNIPGAIIGGLGGAVTGGVLGLAQELPVVGPIAAGIFQIFDLPAEFIERAAGTAMQFAAAGIDPEQYGTLEDLIQNLPEVWRAGHVAYETGVIQEAFSFLGKYDEEGYAAALSKYINTHTSKQVSKDDILEDGELFYDWMMEDPEINDALLQTKEGQDLILGMSAFTRNYYPAYSDLFDTQSLGYMVYANPINALPAIEYVYRWVQEKLNPSQAEKWRDIRESLQFAEPGEIWLLGQPNPVRVDEVGMAALVEARRRLLENEDPNDVYEDIYRTFGFTGSMGELIGHIALDPVAVIPQYVTKGIGAFGSMTDNVALLRAAEIEHGPISALRLYKTFNQTGAFKTVDELTAFERWYAGVSEQGRLKVLDENYRPTNPFVRAFDWAMGVTPDSKARYFLAMSADNAAALLEEFRGSVDEQFRLWKRVANLDPNVAVEYGKYLGSPEMYTASRSMGTFVQKYGEMLDLYHGVDGATDGLRVLLNDLADALDETPSNILKRIDDAPDARSLLLQLADELVDISDNPKAAEILQAITRGEIDNAAIDGLRVFIGDDAIAWHPEQFQAQVWVNYVDHSGKWAAQAYGLKPRSGFFRFFDVLKSAQSAILLGWNPTYFANNMVNNVVTRAVTGVFGFARPSTINNFFQRWGYQPYRLRAGVGPAGIYEHIRFMEDPTLAAGKEPPIGAFGGEVGEARVRRGLMPKDDIIKKAQNITNAVNKFSPALRGGQWMEIAESMQAWYFGMKRTWAKLWQSGNGYTQMPPSLVTMLRNVDPNLPGLVDQVIRNSVNRAEIVRDVYQQSAKYSAVNYLDDIAREMKISNDRIRDVVTPIIDWLEDEVGRAESKDDIDNIFTKAEQLVQDEFDRRVQSSLIDAMRDAREKIATGGLAEATRIWDDMHLRVQEFWTNHFDQWEWTFELAADMLAAGMTRKQIGRLFDVQMAKSNRTWRRIRNFEKATMSGTFEALGFDDVKTRQYSRALERQYTRWGEFYELRRERIQAHVRADFETNAQRKAAWNQIEGELKIEYQRVTDDVAGIQKEVDDLFVDMVGQQYGTTGFISEGIADPAEAARAWRDSSRQMTEKRVEMMRNFREELSGLEWGERRARWQEFLQEEYLPFIYEFYADSVERAAELYRIITGQEPGAATPPTGQPPTGQPPTGGETPPTPAPQPAPGAGEGGAQQPQPRPQPQPPAQVTKQMRQHLRDLGYTPIEIQKLRPDQAQRIIQGRIESPNSIKARRTEIRRIAGEDFQVDTVKAGDNHLLNILKSEEYGGDPNIQDISDISAERAREILQRRAEIKAEQVARVEVKPEYFGDDTSAISIHAPGQIFEFRYRVIDLDDLITSHSRTGALNTNYAQELQGRARERSINIQQFDQIAKDFIPEAYVWDTHRTNNGTPIIGSDLMVESGNGRTLALQHLIDYYPEKWQAYQDSLRQHLPDIGINPDVMSDFEKPVLVRERTSDVNREWFADIANAREELNMSKFEIAVKDAQNLSDTAIANLKIGTDESIEQALMTVRNNDFVAQFFEIVPFNERADLLDAHGAPSPAIIGRIKNALFVRTYPGEAGRRLIQLFSESADNNIKHFENAIFQSLPDMSKVEAGIRAGYIDQAYSLGEDLIKSVDQYARLRQQNISKLDYFEAETIMFKELDNFQDAILLFLYENNRSAKPLRELLRKYAQLAEDAPRPGQADMFTGSAPTKGELLDAAADFIGKGEDYAFADVGTQAPRGVAAPETGAPTGVETGPGAVPPTEPQLYRGDWLEVREINTGGGGRKYVIGYPDEPTIYNPQIGKLDSPEQAAFIAQYIENKTQDLGNRAGGVSLYVDEAKRAWRAVTGEPPDVKNIAKDIAEKELLENVKKHTDAAADEPAPYPDEAPEPSMPHRDAEIARSERAGEEPDVNTIKAWQRRIQSELITRSDQFEHGKMLRHWAEIYPQKYYDDYEGFIKMFDDPDPVPRADRTASAYKEEGFLARFASYIEQDRKRMETASFMSGEFRQILGVSHEVLLEWYEKYIKKWFRYDKDTDRFTLRTDFVMDTENGIIRFEEAMRKGLKNVLNTENVDQLIRFLEDQHPRNWDAAEQGLIGYVPPEGRPPEEGLAPVAPERPPEAPPGEGGAAAPIPERAPAEPVGAENIKAGDVLVSQREQITGLTMTPEGFTVKVLNIDEAKQTATVLLEDGDTMRFRLDYLGKFVPGDEAKFPRPEMRAGPTIEDYRHPTEMGVLRPPERAAPERPAEIYQKHPQIDDFIRSQRGEPAQRFAAAVDDAVRRGQNPANVPPPEGLPRNTRSRIIERVTQFYIPGLDELASVVGDLASRVTSWDEFRALDQFPDLIRMADRANWDTVDLFSGMIREMFEEEPPSANIMQQQIDQARAPERPGEPLPGEQMTMPGMPEEQFRLEAEQATEGQYRPEEQQPVMPGMEEAYQPDYEAYREREALRRGQPPTEELTPLERLARQPGETLPRRAGEGAPGAPEGGAGVRRPGTREGVPEGVRRPVRDIDAIRRRGGEPAHLENTRRPPLTRTLQSDIVKAVLDENVGQQTDVRRILSAYDAGEKAYVLANWTGTGKTFVALGAIVEQAPRRTLIIVPNRNIATQWADVAREYFGIHISTNKTPPQQGAWITTYASMRANMTGYDMVIFDESHKLKTYGTSNESAQAARGVALVGNNPDANVLYMSATPFQGLPEMRYLENLGMWDPNAIIRTADGTEVFTGFDAFLVQNGYNLVRGQYGDFWKFNGTIDNILDIHKQMNEKGVYSMRELIVDVDMQNRFHRVPLNERIRSAYDNMYARFEKAKTGVSPEYKGLIEAQRTIAARRIMEIQKVDEAIRLARDLNAEGRQVAIFVGYRGELKPPRFRSSRLRHVNEILEGIYNELNSLEGQSIARLVEELGGEDAVAQIHGGISVAQRNKEIDHYNSGRKKFMIATAAAGGTGLSLHDVNGTAPRAQINIYLPWSGQDFMQVAGRSYRYGSKSDVIQYWLFADTMKEASVASVVGGRLSEMGALVQGITGDLTSDRLRAFDFGLLDDPEFAPKLPPAPEGINFAHGLSVEPMVEPRQFGDYFVTEQVLESGAIIALVPENFNYEGIRVPEGRATILGLSPDDPNVIVYEVNGEIKHMRQISGASASVGPLPPGGAEQITPSLHNGMTEDDLWNTHMRHVLDSLRQKMITQGPKAIGGWADNLDPAAKATLESYLNTVGGELHTAKRATTRWAENLRDQSLLNYSMRRNIDNITTVMFPYQFWYTRSMLNWMMRLVDKPRWFANWYRLEKFMNSSMTQPGFPTRMTDRMSLEAPFLPDWSGGKMWVDPLKQLFPMDQLMSPIDYLIDQKTSDERDAEYILAEWVRSGQVSRQDASRALAGKTGDVWGRAVGEAKKRRLSEEGNGLAFMDLISSPALYFTLPYYLFNDETYTGRKDMPLLPMTRTGLGIEGITQDTALDRVINGAIGVSPIAEMGRILGRALSFPESELRRRAGMSQFGEWGEYWIERQISNMVMEGVVGVEEGEQAMISNSGPAWDEALRRIKLEIGLRLAGGHSMYAALNPQKIGEDPMAYIASLLFGYAGATLLPPAEMEHRQLKDEYNAAREQYNLGDGSAYERFFEKYPEYRARQALFEEPQERMRNFLITNIWNAWGELGSLEKQQITEQFGQVFEHDFLDRDTHNYDIISTDTLAFWAQQLGQQVPQPAEEGILTGEEPDIDFDQLMLAPPDEAEEVNAYRQTRNQLFPNWYAVQSWYFSFPKGSDERKAIVDQFPWISDYWDWAREQKKQHPVIEKYTKAPEESAALGYDYSFTQEIDAVLARQLYGYFLAGEALTGGAKKTLQRIWEDYGYQGGDFETFLDVIVKSIIAP